MLHHHQFILDRVESVNSYAAHVHLGGYDGFYSICQGKWGLSHGPAGCRLICPQNVGQLLGLVTLGTVQSSLQPIKIVLLTASACLLHWGYIEVEYLFMMPRPRQKSRKTLLSNCNLLSEMRVSGIPNLVTMFFHTNFLTSTSQMLARASASAHLVK